MTEPRWVRFIALSCTLILATFGAVGLVLADVGVYSLWLVLVIGLPAFTVLFRWTRPLLQSDTNAADLELRRTDRNSAIAAVVLSAMIAIWNGVNASQHVQINRDGGLYLNAGKWIARHGTLNLRPFNGPFASYAHSTTLIATSTGMKQQGSHVEFEISHMLPAVLAEAQNIGGNQLMFLTVPILSGVALLVFYLLAARLLRQPIAALAATVTLALLMPQVSFSRDSTTEIPIQVLLFSALWLLCDRRTLRRPRPAFVAGLLLGLVQAMHIDGLAFLVGVPAIFAITWLHTNRDGRTRLKTGFLWAAAGVGVGLLAAALDMLRWDHSYFSVVRGNVERLAAAEILAIAAAVGVTLFVQRTHVFDAIQRQRARAASPAGVLVLIGGFGAWVVRPIIQDVHAPGVNATVQFVQRINHLPIDGTERYAQLSVQWISWYVGPITLTIAIIGAAAVTYALVRGSLRLPNQIAAFLFVPPALLYIWRPSITPDQIWAARRFLPAVFPATILLAFAVLCALVRAPDPRFRRERRAIAIMLAVATVAFPVITLRNVSQMTEQRGLLPAINYACKILGHNSAVVVLQEAKSVVWESDPQTLRSFCDDPVMVMINRPNPVLLHSLSAQWEHQGRQMFVVASAPATILRVLPNADLRVTGRWTNPHFLEQTLTRRPSKYTPELFQLTMAQVPPIAGTVNKNGASVGFHPTRPVTPKAEPAPPTEVDAIAGIGRAIVSWKPPPNDNDYRITAYTVIASDGQHVTVAAPQTHATVSGLTAGARYTFRVDATTTIGTSAMSAPSKPVTIPPGVPSAPLDPDALPGDRAVQLVWQPPAHDGGSVITNYTVTTTPGAHQITIPARPGAIPTVTIHGLTNGTQYRFTVYATNALGHSVNSAASNPVTPYGPPGAPTGVHATEHDGRVVVSWTAPANDNGDAINQYRVTASPGGMIAGIDAPHHSITIEDLTRGKEYTFTVVALNDAANGPASLPSNAVIVNDPA
ncbi:MAG: fibronectin type III domain-containing protein [Acidimicrobiia bacterium]